MPESPLWTAANHRYEEAERALMKIAKWNNVSISGIHLKRENPKANKKDTALTCKEEENVLMQNGSPSCISDQHLQSAIDVKVTDLAKDTTLRKHAAIASLLWYVHILIQAK